MGLLSKFRREPNAPSNASARQDNSPTDLEFNKEQDGPLHIFNWRVIYMGILVSMGGFIFGYDTGQISGFVEMPDFLHRFADSTDPATGEPKFSNGRSGTIVGLLSIGTLLGALIAAPISDKFGRKYSIVFWNLVFCVGVIVQIVTTYTWYQIALGRWVAGLGVGGLSVLTPMYQSETAPRQVRGALVSAYQLFITLGIFVAYCINYGTEAKDNADSWRIPMGVGFIWPAIMAFGMLLLPESPRWQYRHGKVDTARATIAMSYGVSPTHPIVNNEIREIKTKLDAENAGGGKHPWYEIFTGPRMAYRTILGITLQALQQLTGANFFFYYGTTIFTATGLSNSYVTSMILGAVNFGCTFPGLYFVDRFGRRPCLMAGAAWMFMCFLVFASVGHFALDQNNPTSTPKAGSAMIVFACLFIAAYASTWGPMVWAVVGEIYPSRYRAKCMSMATASNWAWNFLISFFTPYITGAIDYRYGYVFAGCLFAAFFIVYFFLCESQGRSLEEIDTMYCFGVKAWKSKDWQPPEGEDLTTLDSTYLTPGARDIRKPGAERRENIGGEEVEKKDVYHPETQN
ncbi:mfs monosaccharide [Diplodia corticola]|uniref:Mfs monosaccharide n=1 Tax=Diplodia corticola TaxID=236234 RepID=A0A1J9S1Q6_9PEZI|nr:mfs monosaccharide [Diplodia corticola]OJD33589.1 mfs monosaccharide [Diplodia corticola]